MAELLPEFWTPAAGKDSGVSPASRAGTHRRKRTVTDIATWVQCFATYTSVLSGPYPDSVPELLAYLIFILRTSQDFGGVAWVTYDAAFRRQAVITGNRQWSRVNPSLYSICFAGAARTGVRCELCLSLSHPTRECTLVSDPDPDVTSRLKTLESAVLAFTSQPAPVLGGQTRPRSSEVCRSWNAGRCRILHCRYRHVCRVCGGPNPAFSCCDRALSTRPSPIQPNPNLQPLGQIPPGGVPTSTIGLFPRRSGPGSTDRGGHMRSGPRPY